MGNKPGEGEEAADVDVEDLAARLPGRPLSHREVRDLADSLAWSISSVTQSTENGTEYVPEMYLFRPSERVDDGWFGDALVLAMDDELEGWTGRIEKSDVSHPNWLQVLEQDATLRGGELETQSIVVEREDGETMRRDLRSSRADDSS